MPISLSPLTLILAFLLDSSQAASPALCVEVTESSPPGCECSVERCCQLVAGGSTGQRPFGCTLLERYLGTSENVDSFCQDATVDKTMGVCDAFRQIDGPISYDVFNSTHEEVVTSFQASCVDLLDLQGCPVQSELPTSIWLNAGPLYGDEQVGSGCKFSGTTSPSESDKIFYSSGCALEGGVQLFAGTGAFVECLPGLATITLPNGGGGNERLRWICCDTSVAERT